MAYVITPDCVCDASCVPVCPVNAIAPIGSFEAIARAGQLFIDPRACIDCGACAPACPVDAIYPAERLPSTLRDHAELNRQFFLTTGDASA